MSLDQNKLINVIRDIPDIYRHYFCYASNPLLLIDLLDIMELVLTEQEIKYRLLTSNEFFSSDNETGCSIVSFHQPLSSVPDHVLQKTAAQTLILNLIKDGQDAFNLQTIKFAGDAPQALSTHNVSITNDILETSTQANIYNNLIFEE